MGLGGDGVRLVKHALQHTGSVPEGILSDFEWIEPPIEFDVTYPMDPETGRYAEGTHQVPSYLDRIILWRSKRANAKMEPGSWTDTDYKCLRDVIGSDHLPVQKHIKFVWNNLPKRPSYTPADTNASAAASAAA